jgi:4-amino-4-deoxy-L-arabinose transferase-like glycosyltransferase
MSHLKRKEILILTLCLLLGFALRFYGFDQKSLWIDEVHTSNDSRDDLKGQLKYYEENPTYLHPPLFFVLTHIFHPFARPERDLRIVPLVFGVLSIPMIYFLSRSFSPAIALPCTLSLIFMTYHVYFSQDGRMYSLMMFVSMVSICFFMRHLETSKKRYLIIVAFCFAILFHTSYSSILFIGLSQMFWFYRMNDTQRRPAFSSFLVLSGVTLLLCLPWILFLAAHYKGQPMMDPLTDQDIGSLWTLTQALLNDWAPFLPLMIASAILLALFPIVAKNRRNALILLTVLIFPMPGLYFYCRVMGVTQFITSRYFICFLPLLFIVLYFSLDAIESRFDRLKKLIRPQLLFLILFILSNAVMLPLYYQGEKQDFRGLANFLNGQLRDGDKVVVGTFTYIPGILHYFGVQPRSRHYDIPFAWIDPGKEFEFKVSLKSDHRSFNIYHSNIPYARYVADGSRLWIVVGKGATAEEIRKVPVFVLKGYFDGSMAMFRRFPSDASMHVFLWDPQSREKGTLSR